MGKKWKQIIEQCTEKARRAINHDGVDPISGFSLSEIENFITWNPPAGTEHLINKALHKIAEFRMKQW